MGKDDGAGSMRARIFERPGPFDRETEMLGRRRPARNAGAPAPPTLDTVAAQARTKQKPGKKHKGK